ncbi:MAG: hypothetical protein ACRD4Q_00090 [Candidatus Acidiferrales bacterium]
MPSVVPNIPLVFMRPDQKYALMNWLAKQLGVPGRIAALVLEQWGAELHVEIWPSDYELVRNHMIVSPARGMAGSD